MDRLDAKARSENMRRIHSRNTAPELTVRSLLHRMGYRFRLHAKNLPGKPDIVLHTARLKTVIFVHGCFWHQHAACRDGRLPESRKGYWIPKLIKNKERDRLHCSTLKKLGWKPVIVWECEMQKLELLQEKLESVLGKEANC